MTTALTFFEREINKTERLPIEKSNASLSRTSSHQRSFVNLFASVTHGAVGLFSALSVMGLQYYQKMAPQGQKGRGMGSSIRRLVCSSVKDREDYYDEEGTHQGPLLESPGTTSDASFLEKPSPLSASARRGGMVDLDDLHSLEDSNTAPALIKTPSQDSSRRRSSTLKRQSSAKKKSDTRPHTPARTKSGSSIIPKRWHGDGGDDQPVLSPSRKSAASTGSGHHGAPPRESSWTQAWQSGSNPAPHRRNSPSSVADAHAGIEALLSFDSSPSNTSLIKRVELIKARADAILAAQKKNVTTTSRSSQREMDGRMSVKSMSSSIHTEPTVEATFSDSTHSRSYKTTISERMKRLQVTRSKLQRYSDERSESSTIRSDTLRLSPSYYKANKSSLLELSHGSSSFEDDTTFEEVQQGFKTNGEGGGDVLRMLRMLEQINGYDLSVFDNTLDEGTILDLDLSFLHKEI